jgi:APA family basic amino acid/polyamine antiporter
MNPERSERSRRSFGFWSTTALVAGHTIGVGIFLTPAQLIGALASPALTLGLWLVCGTLVLAGALTFGELASRYPQAGGLYVYLQKGWGAQIAFLYGWQSLLIMDPGLTAALAAGLAQYLVAVWPAAAGNERWLAIGAIWILALVNLAGVTLSARVFTAMTALKLLALAAVVLAAFAVGDGSWSHFVPFFGTEGDLRSVGEAMSLGLIGVFFSFGGFWEASRVAGEVREPSRTLPFALAVGVVLVTVAYVVTTMAFMYLVPPSDVTSASDFARRAGEAMFGASGPVALASVVIISVAASLMALLMLAPRLYVAMGDDGLFVPALARVNSATGVPIRATFLLATLASLFVTMGTFDQIVAFFICTSLVFVAMAAAALFVVRARRSEAGAFQVPGYPLMSAMFVLLVAGVVLIVGVNRPIQAIAGFALVLLGVPAYRKLKVQSG